MFCIMGYDCGCGQERRISIGNGEGPKIFKKVNLRNVIYEVASRGRERGCPKGSNEKFVIATPHEYSD